MRQSVVSFHVAAQLGLVCSCVTRNTWTLTLWLLIKHHTFEMFRVFTKVWYTAMINGNCGNRTVVGMMSCCLLCATISMLDFLLAMTFHFSVFLFVTVHHSHGLPVWSCKSWVSVLVLDIKVLVLVLVLVLKLLSLGLGLGLEPQSLGLGLGLGTSESWSWSWSWISKSWIQVCIMVMSKTTTSCRRIIISITIKTHGYCYRVYRGLQAKTIHVTFHCFSNKRFQSAKVGLNVNYHSKILKIHHSGIIWRAINIQVTDAYGKQRQVICQRRINSNKHLRLLKWFWHAATRRLRHCNMWS